MERLDQLINELYGPSLRSRLPAMASHVPASEDTLNSLARSGLSALQYIGQTLDKPGRSVRGLLAGKPEELLNVIPFSSTIGLRQGWPIG